MSKDRRRNQHNQPFQVYRPFEPRLTSLDAAETKRIRRERIKTVRSKADRLFTQVGAAVLTGLEKATITPETPAPPVTPERQRRLGRNIVAATALSLVVFSGAVINEHLNPTPGDCVTVSLDDLDTSDPIEAAREVSKRFVGEDARPNAVEMAHQFDDHGRITECDNTRVESIYRDLANN